MLSSTPAAAGGGNVRQKGLRGAATHRVWQRGKVDGDGDGQHLRWHHEHEELPVVLQVRVDGYQIKKSNPAL